MHMGIMYLSVNLELLNLQKVKSGFHCISLLWNWWLSKHKNSRAQAQIMNPAGGLTGVASEVTASVYSSEWEPSSVSDLSRRYVKTLGELCMWLSVEFIKLGMRVTMLRVSETKTEGREGRGGGKNYTGTLITHAGGDVGHRYGTGTQGWHLSVLSRSLFILANVKVDSDRQEIPALCSLFIQSEGEHTQQRQQSAKAGH